MKSQARRTLSLLTLTASVLLLPSSRVSAGDPDELHWLPDSTVSDLRLIVSGSVTSTGADRYLCLADLDSESRLGYSSTDGEKCYLRDSSGTQFKVEDQRKFRLTPIRGDVELDFVDVAQGVIPDNAVQVPVSNEETLYVCRANGSSAGATVLGWTVAGDSYCHTYSKNKNTPYSVLTMRGDLPPPTSRVLTARGFKSSLEQADDDDRTEILREVSAGSDECMPPSVSTAVMGSWEGSHSQSIARLPDDGTDKVRYMVTYSDKSDAHAGWLFIIERPTLTSTSNGSVIWCERLDESSEIGHWGHPGQVDRVGDAGLERPTMAVAMTTGGDHNDEEGIVFLDVSDPTDVKRFPTIFRPNSVTSPDMVTFTAVDSGSSTTYRLAIFDEDKEDMWVFDSSRFQAADPAQTWSNTPTASGTDQFHNGVQACHYVRKIAGGQDTMMLICERNGTTDGGSNDNEFWAKKVDVNGLPFNGNQNDAYTVDGDDGKVGFRSTSHEHCNLQKASGLYIGTNGELWFQCTESVFQGSGLGYAEYSATPE